MLLGKSLREVEALDADEILWWGALFAVDPPGDQRQDQRFAMLAQMVAAFGGKPPPLRAFMLYPQGDPEQQTVEQQRAELAKTTEWLSGNDGRQASRHPDS